jgi:hypothetical protein
MELMDEDSRQAYPAVNLFVRHGGIIAVLVALIAPAAALWLWAVGYNPLVLVAGVAAGALVFLLMRSYTELVRIIADMLLPK